MTGRMQPGHRAAYEIRNVLQYRRQGGSPTSTPTRLDREEAPPEPRCRNHFGAWWGFPVTRLPRRVTLGGYLPFFLVDSFTVPFGLRRTVDCFTKRPVVALRPRLPPLDLLLLPRGTWNLLSVGDATSTMHVATDIWCHDTPEVVAMHVVAGNRAA
jgi:hypothetical protein